MATPPLKIRFSSRPLRPLCFDLENRPLAYWYDGQTTSEITAFGWKWADEQHVRTLLLCADGAYRDEQGAKHEYPAAHELFASVLASAGLVYGHNIRHHDLPMLQAWRLRLQLDPIGPLLTTDTYKDIPKASGMSKSLENLAALYALDGEKHRMTQPAWEKANQLHSDGIEQARVRVESDVLLQESLRRKLIERGLLKPPREWKS